MTNKNVVVLTNLLRERGLKATPFRIHLLDMMTSRSSSVTYSEIIDKNKDVDRVTVYRTLETLQDKGLIHKCYSDSSDTYYAVCQESCTTEGHHHDHIHVLCQNCDKITCEELAEPIQISLEGMEIKKKSILVEVICPDCLQ